MCRFSDPIFAIWKIMENCIALTFYFFLFSGWEKSSGAIFFVAAISPAPKRKYKCNKMKFMLRSIRKIA